MNDLWIESDSQITYDFKMIFKSIKITAILISFILLTGFIPFIALIGPSFTAATSGSFYKAGAQYLVNKGIKNTTGKNSLELVKENLEKIEKTEKNNSTNLLNQQIQELVERRIALVRKKLSLNNINQ